MTGGREPAGGVLLDVSRTISRAGLGPPTGIDRVERRWIGEALAGRWGPAQFLARVSGGVFVVGDGSMRGLIDALDGAAPAPALDLRGRASLKKRPEVRRIESGFRRAAVAARPAAFYANVGHSNLTPAMLAAARAMGARRVVVKIHDVIPLDHPEFARPDGPAKMRERIAAAEAADLVIYNSAHTRSRAEAHMTAPPPACVAPLGVEVGAVDAQPHGGFVTLGTIEPRKNHILLLDLWERLGDDPPTLHIVGRRGWMNEAVFRRLDARPRGIVEHGGLDDEAALRLLAGARALLFPSFAEGYGLPLAEALTLGRPAIVSELPALREVGGDLPTYLPPDASDLWLEAIKAAMAAEPEAAIPEGWSPPTWTNHFAAVDMALAATNDSTDATLD